MKYNEGSQRSPWRIAKRSGDSNCVQVRSDNDLIVVGSSRFPEGPFLSYTKDEWAAFLDGAKKGEFDDFLAH
jgi:Domain of unknown function (DUF397)